MSRFLLPAAAVVPALWLRPSKDFQNLLHRYFEDFFHLPLYRKFQKFVMLTAFSRCFLVNFCAGEIIKKFPRSVGVTPRRPTPGDRLKLLIYYPAGDKLSPLINASPPASFIAVRNINSVDILEFFWYFCPNGRNRIPPGIGRDSWGGRAPKVVSFSLPLTRSFHVNATSH